MTDAILAARTEERRAEAVVSELERQLVALAEQRDAAADEVAVAKASFTTIAGLCALKEATQEDVSVARRTRDDCTDRVEALDFALRELARRLEVARAEVTKARSETLRLVRPLAAAFAEKTRSEVHVLAEQLGESMARWSRVRALSWEGGFMTGDAQVSLLGSVRADLAKHRVDAQGELYIRHIDARDDMTVEEFLQLIS